MDFPPFRVRWAGELIVPRSGDYEFKILTSDEAKLWLDEGQVTSEKKLFLSAGAHSLRLDYQKWEGDFMALHLLWKKPGQENWEVVPATAFGRIR
jgi:hypothetical protein